MKSLKQLISVAITLAGIMVMAFGSLSCSRGYSGLVESITIGSAGSIVGSIPIDIAQQQQFFANNKLTVTVKGYTEGVNSISGLLNDEVEVALASEYALVGNAFNRDKISIVAITSKAGTYWLVARKDSGIGNIADLKGKHIGVQFKTISEFSLGRFLNLNGMQMTDVTAVDLWMDKLPEALTNGSVDAVVLREPSLTALKEELGTNGVSWPIQSHQLVFGVLVARNDWIKGHPELLKRLLRSWAQTEDYISKHPDEIQAAIGKRLNYSKEALASFSAGIQFSLSLDQSLIIAMEDEARWMMQNNLTPERQMPDFRSYIYTDALKAIKPEAVNIR